MARFKDPAAELGTVKTMTDAQRRRRRQQERAAEIADRAEWLLENDPDINTQLEARREAKKQIEEISAYNAGVRKGSIDPDTGELTKQAQKRKQRKDSPPRGDRSRRRRTQRTSPRRGPKSGSAVRRADRFAARSVEMVAAPYGSVASAAWTFFMGAIGIGIFYVLLSREGSAFVSAFASGIVAGFRRFSDPWVPLFPSKNEASKPADTKASTPPLKRKNQPTYIPHASGVSLGG